MLKQEEIFPSAPWFWCFRYFSLVPNYNKRSIQTTPDLKSMWKLVCAFSQSDLPFHLLCFRPVNDFYHRSCSQQHWAPPCTLPTSARPPRPPGSHRLPGRRSTSRTPPRWLRGGRVPAPGARGPFLATGCPGAGLYWGSGWVRGASHPRDGPPARRKRCVCMHGWATRTTVCRPRETSLRRGEPGKGLWHSAATGLCCVPSAAPRPRVWALLSKFILFSKLTGKTRRSACLCDQPHWAWKLDLTWRLARATRRTISDEGWDGVQGQGAAGQLCCCPRRKDRSWASPMAVPAGDASRCRSGRLGAPLPAALWPPERGAIKQLRSL